MHSIDTEVAVYLMLRRDIITAPFVALFVALCYVQYMNGVAVDTTMVLDHGKVGIWIWHRLLG